MTDQSISPLRRRMIEDMTIRKFAPKTQAAYIRAERNFTRFLGRSPDQASAEDLRRYQLHLASSGVSGPSINAAVSALRFFFRVTLGRGEATEKIRSSAARTKSAFLCASPTFPTSMNAAAESRQPVTRTRMTGT